jgi:hypothetical protein
MRAGVVAPDLLGVCELELVFFDDLVGVPIGDIAREVGVL